MENNNLSLFTFGADIVIPELKEKTIRGKDYVSFGVDNKYPEFLLKCYDECAEHQSIIDGCVNYVLGTDLIIADPALKAFAELVNDGNENLADVLKKCELDYQIYGGFAVKIIMNNFKELSQLQHLKLNYVRVNKDETQAFYSENFGTYAAETEVFEIFDPLKPKSNTVYYYKGKKFGKVYPKPLYNAAIKAIQVSMMITDYHMYGIASNFNPNAIINFYGNIPSPEAKSEIERDIKEKFTGTKGQRVLVQFNNLGQTGATIDRLKSDDDDEKFKTLRRDIRDTIFTSHRITSPALFGVIIENTGFSAVEYEEAFGIYNKTIIEPLQKDLTSEFKKIFKPFFKDPVVKIQPFSIESTASPALVKPN